MRFFGLICAFVLSLSTVSFALTPSERYVQEFLFPETFATATPEEIALAVVDALNTDPEDWQSFYSSLPRGQRGPVINADRLAGVGFSKAPRFSATVAGAALQSLQNDTGLSLARRNRLVDNVVQNALRRIIQPNRGVGYIGAANVSDAAAEVTAVAVDSVRDNTQLLTRVVRTAVATVRNFGRTQLNNGPGGVVTGAIAQVAGFSNEDLGDGDADDLLVNTVITTAVQTARNRVLNIALAAGYAFAGTYLATTGDTDQIDELAFREENLPDLLLAVRNGLRGRTRDAVLRALEEQITIGIALAFDRFPGPGGGGVSDGEDFFAFNNGFVPGAVTDILGF